MSSEKTITKRRKRFLELMYCLEQEQDWDGVREVGRIGTERGCWNHPDQRPGDMVQGLTANPVWSPSDFWFVDLLEAAAPAIIAEVESLGDRLDEALFKVPDEIYQGTWNQIGIYECGRLQPDACALLPTLADTLAKIPEISTMVDGCAGISKLSAGTHITPHCGSTNARLRVHMGLQNVEDCHMRVGDHELRWELGKCFVFDDSFEHEVFHNGSKPRVILLADFWHPDMSPELIKHYAGPHSRKVRLDGLKQFMRRRGIRRIEIDDQGGAMFEADSATRSLVESRCKESGIRLLELKDNGKLRVERFDVEASA